MGDAVTGIEPDIRLAERLSSPYYKGLVPSESERAPIHVTMDPLIWPLTRSQHNCVSFHAASFTIYW